MAAQRGFCSRTVDKNDQYVPMSMQSLRWGQPHQQLSSPLYSRIPPEIRTLIFEYALSETTLPHPLGSTHDFCVRYDHGLAEGEEVAEEQEATDDEMQESDNEDETMSDGNVGPEIEEPDDEGDGDEQVIGFVDEDEYEYENEDEDEDGGWESDSNSDAPYMDEMHEDWLRPDYRGLKKVFTALLQTCRRIYLEARHLPALNTEHIFWMGRGPYGADGTSVITDYLSHLPLDIALQIRSIHLTTQLWWLERYFRADVDASAKGVYDRPSNSIRIMDRLEELRITIRRRDWWYNEQNEPLRINPFGYEHAVSDNYTLSDMRHDIKASVERGVRQNPGLWSWSTAFLSIPRLKKLIIDFETGEDKRGEMEQIVKWAQTWRFPVIRKWSLIKYMDIRFKVNPVNLQTVSHAYLSATENPVSKMSWRGFPYQWAQQCPRCQTMKYRNAKCSWCTKVVGLLEQGKGPRMLVWTVVWTAEPDYIPEEERPPAQDQTTDSVQEHATANNQPSTIQEEAMPVELPSDEPQLEWYRTASVYF